MAVNRAKRVKTHKGAAKKRVKTKARTMSKKAGKVAGAKKSTRKTEAAKKFESVRKGRFHYWGF